MSRNDAADGSARRVDRTRPEFAFFLRAMEGGGAQRDTILLANELASRGRAVDLLTLVPEGPLRALVRADVAIVPVRGGRLRSAVAGLRRAVLDRRPRILLSSEAAPNLVALIAARLIRRHRRPRIVLREVGSPSISQRLDPFRQTRIAYRLLRHSYRWADLVVALTAGAARDLAADFGVPREKLARIGSNAVIDERGAGGAADVGETREPGLIVAVGRLSPEKDHATLIKAFAKLERTNRLEIVGDGPLRPRLEALVGELGLAGRVTLTGFVLDPFSVFRRAQLAVSASRHEGFGNALVEALACGTPVVSTDCPYGPREILADGRYGSLVPVGDADALAAAMKHALASRPDRAALRARAANHTAARAADALLDIIDRLAWDVPAGA